jgi:hypothetical protein
MSESEISSLKLEPVSFNRCWEGTHSRNYAYEAVILNPGFDDHGRIVVVIDRMLINDLNGNNRAHMVYHDGQDIKIVPFNTCNLFVVNYPYVDR